MEVTIKLLDYVLVAASLWAVYSVRGLGGLIGQAFTFIMWGMIFLGVAHLSQTLTVEFLAWDALLVSLVHRSIVLAGFGFLILGFAKLPRIKQALS